ncbi:hypothetical protein GCK72_004341 [Caenorhabditis remanei]|uniref:F-box associated domain-containing protein n=1 Tax=Caenorhabditis remanei TaxID=31234 RepID=A0A6A5HC51_CAERE|nr:hypothetical protein GCK72_004341 [Caenorhabditis remanei]KAF1764394.1 hypothetical protein GCK72_004341 [Caenorhabditis remanei]
MNPGPPLSYESLKTVLQYMDPNLRIRLFINCPLIRSAEKVVPLKIKKLELSHRWIAIDDTRYTVGIYKKYPAGTCPPRVERENEFGGLATDLDQHGYEDWPGRLQLRPGDVDEGRTTTDATSHFKVKKEFEHARAQAYSELKNRVLNTKAILQQWYARRDGLPVPFESYIMLTISNHETKEKKKVEFVKYEKRLPEALNYLMHRIFENRRHPVAVKLLIPKSEILHLTPGLRMEIEEMNFDGGSYRAFDDIAAYIEESSYPLKSVKACVYHPSIFQHTMLRSAKHLVVRGIGSFEWLPIFLNLENHKAHIIWNYLDETMPVDDYMTLIRHWVSSGKEVGASFRQPLKVEKGAELETNYFHLEVFKEIKAQFKNSISGHRYIF